MLRIAQFWKRYRNMMNGKVVLLGLSELFNQFGNRLTLYSGVFFLAFSSEKNSVYFLSLFLSSQLVSTYLAISLKRFFSFESVFRKLIIVLAIQVFFLIILIVAPLTVFGFIILFFLKSSLNGFYHSFIESIIPFLEKDKAKWFLSNKIYGFFFSLQFLLSLVCSALIYQLGNMKIIFIIDLLTCVIPMVLFLFWSKTFDSVTGDNKQSQLNASVNGLLKLTKKYPFVYEIMINTFSLYLVCGVTSIIEVLYYKNLLNLSPIKMSAIFLMNALGFVAGNAFLSEKISRNLKSYSASFYILIANVFVSMVFFTTSVTLIMIFLFIFGFFESSFNLSQKNRIFIEIDDQDRPFVFLYRYISCNAGMLVAYLLPSLLIGLLSFKSLMISLLLLVLAILVISNVCFKRGCYNA